MTVNNPENQYLDGTYFAQNPDWDRKDCLWKAKLVKSVLDKFKIEINSICEIGCGSGDILVHLKKSYPRYEFIGYDISPQLLPFWQQHAGEGIQFHCGDFLNHNKRNFDCILILDVIEHLTDPYTFLEIVQERAKYFIFHIPLDLNVCTVLREKPLLQSRLKVGHIQVFTKSLALAILRETGFDIIHYEYTNSYLTEPNRTLKTRLASLLRCLAYSINKDFGVRLIGGETLLVLAKASD